MLLGEALKQAFIGSVWDLKKKLSERIPYNCQRECDLSINIFQHKVFLK